jgi:predicted amidohydrolase YtcJ
MNRLKALLLSATLLSVFSAFHIAAQEKAVGTADLVLLNATVYTVSGSLPRAEAVAVSGDRVAAVGTNDLVAAWIGPQTRVIDAAGMTITPGFIESHGHLMGIGWSAKYVDLSNAGSYHEMIRIVAEAVRKARPGEWILGGGWHQSKWSPVPDPMVRGFPTHKALSRISPNNPVFLSHASGHAALANAKAMEIAGIESITKFAEGGEPGYLLKPPRA